MFIRRTLLVMGCGVLTLGCSAQPPEIREIIENLSEAGFLADDIMVVDDVVYVGRDAQVSLAASREMLRAEGSSKEQYRTSNLISSSLTKICVDGSSLDEPFSAALDLAIENYDELPLGFAMARAPAGDCSFTISMVIRPGLVGGEAGFPSEGLPFPTITIGGGLRSFSIDTIEHVVTHEIGHAIGFRHSDFFNTRISCNRGGDEGNGDVGAIHVPGTPTGAVVGGSIMNACFRTFETGEFTGSDVAALARLYAPAMDLGIAFHANTGFLWNVGAAGAGDTGLGMMPGTSPGIAELVDGGFQVVFQANTGFLWTIGPGGTGSIGLGMRPGTSPSITALAGGGFQIAFHANTGSLWTVGTAGTSDTGLRMKDRTSPSIAALAGGGFQIAFQANTGNLWTTGTAGEGNLDLGMMPGTSPSITGFAGGGFQIAFQANTGNLWTVGAAGTSDTGLRMMVGTSPSITGLTGDEFQIAFQADTGFLWTTGSEGEGDTGLGMMAETSPSITDIAGDGFQVVFQTNGGFLWSTGAAGTFNMGLGMAAGSSPSAN